MLLWKARVISKCWLLKKTLLPYLNSDFRRKGLCCCKHIHACMFTSRRQRRLRQAHGVNISHIFKMTADSNFWFQVTFTINSHYGSVKYVNLIYVDSFKTLRWLLMISTFCWVQSHTSYLFKNKIRSLVKQFLQKPYLQRHCGTWQQ